LNSKKTNIKQETYELHAKFIDFVMDLVSHQLSKRFKEQQLQRGDSAVTATKGQHRAA
jgi:hypothetical protein